MELFDGVGTNQKRVRQGLYSWGKSEESEVERVYVHGELPTPLPSGCHADVTTYFHSPFIFPIR